MYQRCPICEGSGIINNFGRIGANNECPTCNGTRIISQITGMPPQIQKFKLNKYKIDKESADKVFEFLSSSGNKKE